MKSFFASLFFITFLLSPNCAQSGVRSATEPAPTPPADYHKIRQDIQEMYKEVPDQNDKEKLRTYLQKRLQIATPANISPEEINNPSSTSIVDPNELNQKQEDTLSAYEKIYNESMQKVENIDGTLNEDLKIKGVFYRSKEANIPQESFVPDFPYVVVKLSDKREILAPAEEHIAYFLTSIKIEPTGLLDVSEEFTFVSNNEGFPEGFFRIFPKYNYSLDGEKRRIDFTLKSVTINGEEYPYKVTEIGNYLYIEPKTPLNLPTGIYTYTFNYLLDRVIWHKTSTDDLYWDLTGKTIKNVIGSANAVVILPDGKTFKAQNAFVSNKDDINAERVTIANITENSLGFADTEALGVGDDIHILISLGKDVLLPPDFIKQYMWLVQDYGATIFALLALIAIFVSFKISEKQIRRNQDKTQVKLKKTPSLFRLINSNKLDLHSFGAELLNLYSKNIINILPKEETAVMIKKTDNFSKLSKQEQTLVNLLFPGTDTVLNATAEATLKLQRAYKYITQTTFKQFLSYKLKLTGLYLLFALGMLFCGIISASLISVNPMHSFWIISVCAILFLIFIMVLQTHFQNNIVNILIKLLSLIAMLYIAGWLSIYTSNAFAIIIILSNYLIITNYHIFSRRSGLLRNKIKETEELKSYLQKNTEIAEKSKDFIKKIPYIFAFNIENKYPNTQEFVLINHFLKLITPTLKKD